MTGSRGACLALLTGIIGAVAMGFAGARINTTKSIPVGLYWTAEGHATIGSYVMFCPPQAVAFHLARQRRYIDSGTCPGGYGFMMKRVYAVSGDHVEISAGGVTVNGVLVGNSRPLAHDQDGNPMPLLRGVFTISPTELLLMSGVSKTSFDARYFGPVDRAQIRSVIRPIFTW